MKKIRLGKTDLMVTKTAVGCLPLQRCSVDEAVKILNRAVDAGINYFDTANAYSDSEEKLGLAFEGKRSDVIISTKSMGFDGKTVTEHIETSLKRLRTDYIDLLQFHNPQRELDPNDTDGPYAAALSAKAKGYIRHIGVTAHRLPLAIEHVKSELYETMQFPFSYISLEKEADLTRLCDEYDMGFIAMKGLAGGLLTNTRACHAFMKEYENVVPIWGVQTMDELEDWIALAAEDPSLDDGLRGVIEADKAELSGGFCRGCNYCGPCPAGIEIWNSARMNMLLRRSPWKQYYTDEWRSKMNLIDECQQCGQCIEKCPYGVNPPVALPKMLEDYNAFYEEHKHELV